MLKILLASLLLAIVSPAYAQNSTTGGAITNAIPPGPNFVMSGLLAAYMLTEGSGTTLNDSSGNGFTTTLPSSSPPVWTADGGLSFPSGTTPVDINVGLQGVQTIEFVYVPTLTPGAPTDITTIGYVGAYPATTFGSLYAYNGGSSSTQGYSAAHPSYMQQEGSTGSTIKANGFSGLLDQSLHVMTYEMPQSSLTNLIYLDKPVLQATTYNGIVANATTGGHYQIAPTSPGTLGCLPYSGCGGKYVLYGMRFYSTVLTTAQIATDNDAWRAFLRSKGTNVDQYTAYPASASPINLHCVGESLTWGHPGGEGTICGNAATALTTALGATVTASSNGNDSDDAYLIAPTCGTLLKGVASPVSTNIALIMTNGNDVRNKLANSGVPTYGVTGGPATAYAAAGGLATCVQADHALGYKVIIGLAAAQAAATGTTGDGNEKDVVNPIFRAQLSGIADAIWDTATDPRFGADGAATTGAASGYTGCGGGLCYNSDLTHPTTSGYTIMGSQLANVLLGMMNHQSATGIVKPVTTATYQQTGADLYATDRVTTAGAAITLLPVGGQTPGIPTTILNASSGLITVAPGTEYQAGPQDTIDGSTAAVSVGPGASVTYKTALVSDATGTGFWTLQQPQAVPHGITTQSATYTLTAADCVGGGSLIRYTGTSAATFTVPAGLPLNCQVEVIQTASGAVTVSAGSGETLEAAGSANTTSAAGAHATIIIDTASTFEVHG